MTDVAPELPYVMTAGSFDEPVTEVAETGRSLLRERLSRHGAVLLRGYRVSGVDGFGRFATTFSGSPLIEYSERSSPRTSLSGAVYTSTDYPPDQTIFLHNENSYQSSWPRLLYFHCVQPPETEGATPLADIRRIHDSIHPDVREEFERRGWSVVRNFHPGFGASWEYAFGTDDESVVADYCRDHRLDHTWTGKGRLRTTAVRTAVHTHPDTGERVWFNHIVFFHHTTLPEEVREGIQAIFAVEDLPTNTYFGDGGVIPDETVAHLRDCYDKHRVRFDWQAGDVLVVDNMLACHGREPFTGARRIAVAMTNPHTPD
ncbi:TauD/TfdA family dioxygenase [Actinophytocola oryzae]|uniref:Alpha-ketoglutarate-dependent taurine dioxygenase n=1 Tax=Actinophytocola oryzae TaxID=502181 RepID=A0A4R7V1K5_9PSEU|nr:TauD/TfdA family dioxygenase [Actinophytocola oryzae]TDV43188.1 alpha-ketoglutarate-dependent taurine dioxygenase [Actinophytocola oryzae]